MGLNEKWGHLTLLEEVREPELLPGPHGLYKSGNYLPTVYKLQCDCGRIFMVPKKLFPGRHKMKSCGAIDCLYNKYIPPGRPRIAGRRQTISLSVPIEFNERLRDYAVENNTSITHAVQVLVGIGFEQIRAMRETPRQESFACAIDDLGVID